MPHLSSIFLQKPQLLLKSCSALTLTPKIHLSRYEFVHLSVQRSIRRGHMYGNPPQPTSRLSVDLIIPISPTPSGNHTRGRLGFRRYSATASAGFFTDPSTLPPRAAVFWDLDNKQPNDVAPREAANRLRQLASHFGREVDMLAYANRFSKTPPLPYPNAKSFIESID